MINNHTIILYCRGKCCIHDTVLYWDMFWMHTNFRVIHNPISIFWVMVTRVFINRKTLVAVNSWMPLSKNLRLGSSIQKHAGSGSAAPVGGAGGRSPHKKKKKIKFLLKNFWAFFNHKFFSSSNRLKYTRKFFHWYRTKKIFGHIFTF